MRKRLALLLLLVLGSAAAPLTAQQGARAGVPRFEIPDGPLALRGPARPGAFIADVGRRAAIFGEEQGSLEVWTWPLKLVRDLHLAFEIPDYDDPIPGARVAESVTVRPTAQTIRYSHATFTVKQHLFVPLDEAGALILLEVETVRPLDVHVRMHADFDLAWPGSFGGEYITWDASRNAFLLSQGGVRGYNAYIGSPFAVEGTSHPAHDAPMVPSQFTLRFDAGTATTQYIPIVIAGAPTANRDSVWAVYRKLLAEGPRLFGEKASHYEAVRTEQLSLETPDPALDLAVEWAKVNLDQQLVCNPDLGCGLVAGFGRAGAGNFRPGFGWYFGGDAAINSLGMDGLGQHELVARGLRFLARYQRADGKVPHEISHAAARLPWFTDYPYTWFHGDTTPFWIAAVFYYWLASGDDALLAELWPNVVRAYAWSKATDTDGDGLMENPSAGAGAIEVGGLGEGLWTDIYLAGVWTASLEGVARMAEHMGDVALASDARALFDRARRTLERSYWNPDAGVYAFALLEGGAEAERAAAAAAREGPVSRPAPDRPELRVNDALTPWPATAMSFNLLDPQRADAHLARINGADVTVDWGTRLLSQEHPLYEPLHYNNGAVWPFVTGWVALGHFRYHRGWAGWDLVRDVARTTFDFALGRNPELLSGEYYRTLDTTVPDQFFATSMLANPLVRGMLGLEADAPACALRVAPHLPADWDSVTVRGFDAGCGTVDVRIERTAGLYSIALRRTAGERPIRVTASPALPLGATTSRAGIWYVPEDGGWQEDLLFIPEGSLQRSAHDLHVSTTVVLRDSATAWFGYEGGVEIIAPPEPLRVGDRSAGLRITDFRMEGEEYVLAAEGVAGRTYDVALRMTGAPTAVRGARPLVDAGGRPALRITIPAAETRYARAEVRFRS